MPILNKTKEGTIRLNHIVLMSKNQYSSGLAQKEIATIADYTLACRG